MNPQAFDSILGRLVIFYDSCSSEVQRRRIERWTLRLAVSGFLIHLTLIALVRAVPSLRVGVLTELDRNYLHAVYTPFSFHEAHDSHHGGIEADQDRSQRWQSHD